MLARRQFRAIERHAVLNEEIVGTRSLESLSWATLLTIVHGCQAGKRLVPEIDLGSGLRDVGPPVAYHRFSALGRGLPGIALATTGLSSPPEVDNRLAYCSYLSGGQPARLRDRSWKRPPGRRPSTLQRLPFSMFSASNRNRIRQPVHHPSVLLSLHRRGGSNSRTDAGAVDSRLVVRS